MAARRNLEMILMMIEMKISLNQREKRDISRGKKRRSIKEIRLIMAAAREAKLIAPSFD